MRTVQRQSRNTNTSLPIKVQTAMTSNVCGRCFRLREWSPLLQSVPMRGMKSVNTRMKKPMHITRAKLMEVTKYQKPTDLRPMAEQCSMRFKREIVRQPNQVQTFLANQCRQHILGRPLIAVYHNEGLSKEELVALKQRLMKADISLKLFGNAVMSEAIAGTSLGNMRALLVGANIYAVSDEPTVKKLLKLTKRVPKIHLLGGLVENRLMSAKQMAQFSQLPEKGTLQGQLAGLLSQAVGSTYNLLQQNQRALVASLSQLVKQREETSV